jgi:cbb3-type cytochrome oxidase subunit 3
MFTIGGASLLMLAAIWFILDQKKKYQADEA